jgi:hypothetical protein
MAVNVAAIRAVSYAYAPQNAGAARHVGETGIAPGAKAGAGVAISREAGPAGAIDEYIPSLPGRNYDIYAFGGAAPAGIAGIDDLGGADNPRGDDNPGGTDNPDDTDSPDGADNPAGDSGAGGASGVGAGEEYTAEEQQVIAELADRDREVRAHEQAHVSAGGAYIRGGASYDYQSGPDGKRYAVGGEVSIDTSPVRDNPQATIAKMQVVRAAALAPADPSAQDRAVAAAAAQAEAAAAAELNEMRAAEAVSAYTANNYMEPTQIAIDLVA